MKIGFIGLGNMAKAIIGGLLQNHIVEPQDLIGSCATKKTADMVKEQFHMETCQDNRQVAKEADILFLAVKPQFFPEVIAQIREDVPSDKLVISIAAGKTISYIEETFAHPVKLARAMPNTPAFVLEGCTGVCFHESVSAEEKEQVLMLLRAFGRADEVPERLMDTVGAVSGSSPAYVFMLIEAMADAAVEGGMPRKQAYEFAAQAVLGSAKLLLESGKHPGELKDMVCSPGGTTIAGVRILEDQHFRGTVMEALKACMDKSKKL